MELLRVRPGVDALPRTGHVDDDLRLEAIARRGEQSDTLRWQHHLYLPDQDAARKAAWLAVTAGWEVSRNEPMPAPYSGWMLRLVRHDVLTPALVTATRSYFEGLAMSHRGHYDGWDSLGALRTRLDAHRKSLRPRRGRPRRGLFGATNVI